MRSCIAATHLTTIILLGALAGCGPSPSPTHDAGTRDAGDGRDASHMDAAPPLDAAPLDAGEDGGADAGACSVDCSTVEAPPCMMAVCNDGSLPGTPGECVMVSLPDDTACDDGDFCTVDDACSAGTCTGAPNDCGMTPGACQEIVCDPVAETCTSRASIAMNGMPCTYPDLCVSGTTCSDGLCTGGTRMDCSSVPVPSECQRATCNPATGACEIMNANEGGPCIDPAAPCIADNTCTAGVCGGGSTPTDCSAMDSECAVGACDPSSGSCVPMPTNEGLPCDDGDSCTATSECTSGICTSSTAAPCSSTPDGCCPSTCTPANDADCACPGRMIAGRCVYLPTTVSASSQASARSACTALGTGWDLCGASVLCDPATLTYLADSGCNCSGGAATCACGSAANLYVHVTGTSPYYVRGPTFAGCITGTSCTSSVSETCGVALCCH